MESGADGCLHCLMPVAAAQRDSSIAAKAVASAAGVMPWHT